MQGKPKDSGEEEGGLMFLQLRKFINVIVSTPANINCALQVSPPPTQPMRTNGRPSSKRYAR